MQRTLHFSGRSRKVVPDGEAGMGVAEGRARKQSRCGERVRRRERVRSWRILGGILVGMDISCTSRDRSSLGLIRV